MWPISARFILFVPPPSYLSNIHYQQHMQLRQLAVWAVFALVVVVVLRVRRDATLTIRGGSPQRNITFYEEQSLPNSSTVVPLASKENASRTSVARDSEDYCTALARFRSLAVVCLGDSITSGSSMVTGGSDPPYRYSFATGLQYALPSSNVYNFGLPGASVGHDLQYNTTAAYREAIELLKLWGKGLHENIHTTFRHRRVVGSPNLVPGLGRRCLHEEKRSHDVEEEGLVVIVMLGTNDAKGGESTAGKGGGIKRKYEGAMLELWRNVLLMLQLPAHDQHSKRRVLFLNVIPPPVYPMGCADSCLGVSGAFGISPFHVSTSIRNGAVVVGTSLERYVEKETSNWLVAATVSIHTVIVRSILKHYPNRTLIPTPAVSSPFPLRAFPPVVVADGCFRSLEPISTRTVAPLLPFATWGETQCTIAGSDPPTGALWIGSGSDNISRLNLTLSSQPPSNVRRSWEALLKSSEAELRRAFEATQMGRKASPSVELLPLYSVWYSDSRAVRAHLFDGVHPTPYASDLMARTILAKVAASWSLAPT